MVVIRVHRWSVAVLVSGVVTLLLGAFAIGIASATAANAAAAPYQVVTLTYVDTTGVGHHCGSASALGGSKKPANYVGTSYLNAGQPIEKPVLILCQATLKVVK